MVESEAENSVVICLFSSTREISKEFMQATFMSEMSNAEYVFILPWIQSGPMVRDIQNGFIARQSKFLHKGFP